MARAEDQPQSGGDVSDDDSEPPSDGSGSGSDSDSSNSSGYDSEDGSGEEEQGDQDVEAAAAAKKQRVRGDIDAMRRMMADMDAIKTRLQQRFAAERQARAEQLAREEREREVQDAARRKAEEEASVQTESEPTASPQQLHLSQQSVCPPHVVDDAAAATGASALPAVDGVTGFADSAAEAAPNKAKPAGLSLYDLVKVSGLELSRKARCPVRRADPPEELPTRPSNEHERVPPEQHQRQLHYKQQDPAAEQVWRGGDSLLAHDQDSVVGGGHDGSCSDNDSYSASRLGSSLNSMRSHTQQPKGGQSLPPSRHYDENSASVSNSLVSSDAGNRSAVFPDLIQRRDHKFNAAALLSIGKRPPPPTTNDGDESKTDEQRETEAIQCLLFGRR